MNPRSPDQLEPRPVRLDRSLGLGSSAQGDRRRPVSRSSARASLTMTNTAPFRAVTWMVRLRGLAAQRRKRWFGRARPRSAALEWGDVPSEREGHPARCDAARRRQAPDRLVAVVSRSHCRSLREQMRGSKEPGTRGRVGGKRRAAIRRARRARRQPARLWPLWRARRGVRRLRTLRGARRFTGPRSTWGCPPLAHSASWIEGDRHHGQGVDNPEAAQTVNGR